MNRMNKHESGYTLIGVLAIFTIASILAMSLVMLSVNTLKTSKTEVDNQSVFYIAEAGLNSAVNEIEQEVTDAVDKDTFSEKLNAVLKDIEENPSRVEFADFNGSQPKARLSVSLKPNEDDVYTIKSTGEIGNEKRHVEQDVIIGWGEDGNGGNGDKYSGFVAYSFSDMSLDRLHFQGDIGTASHNKGSLKLNNITKGGHIILSKKDNDIITGPHTYDHVREPLAPLPLPKFPDRPLPPEFSYVGVGTTDMLISNTNKQLNLNNIEQWNNLHFTKSIVDIPINDSVKSIYINNLDITNSTINLKGNGTGELNIFVNSNVNIKNSKIIGNNSNNLIFTRSNMNIDTSNIDSSLYAFGGINTSNETDKRESMSVKGSIYTLGSANFDKSKMNGPLFSAGAVMFNNSEIKGSVQAAGSINITNSQASSDIHAEGHMSYSNSEIKGSLYALYDIDLNNSNIFGNIFSERNIIAKNESSAGTKKNRIEGEIVYTPNGKITTKNSEIGSSLLSKSMEITGGSLKYRLPHLSGPLSLKELLNSSENNGGNQGDGPSSNGGPTISPNGNLSEVN